MQSGVRTCEPPSALPAIAPETSPSPSAPVSASAATEQTRWAAHNVRFDDTGTKEFHHPLVGDITTTYNRMDLAADTGLAITIYTATRIQVSRVTQPPRKLGRHAGTTKAVEHRTSALTARPSGA